MVVSGKHRILSLSVLSVALIIYLRVRLNRTSKKREEPAKGTDSRASVGQSYEVFLSFHGRDTRYGFTDFLYHGMVEAGILVFRDSESLHVGQRIGDELLQAIRNSKTYVPIFSKNYASSHWCLRELAHMVECASKPNENKEILPIFFDVEPDDVKLKTNLYSKALSKHQKKFCTEVESWKKALVDVDKIKGWNLKTDESQADFIKSVIETVLRKLNLGNKKIVTEDLVGVDDRVEAIIKMLEVGADSVQFLGIHGMGGIGKTTLAKVIFNQLSSHFRYCHFLSDVRETSQRLGMVGLQIQLLSNFLDSHSTLNQIRDEDHGAIMIEKVLRNKKVLIVLDDVDEENQLKSLAKKVDWFGSGSRIIITTRDQSVLTKLGEVTDEGLVNISPYEVGEMEFGHALKLFSRHAFRRDSPLDQYISLSEKIVHTLGKLPLALQVTGSLLSGKSETFWKDTLKKLEKAPPMEVQKKLMITYEKLDDEQKQVFLDIACFFVNVDKTYPSYMWDACGYYPHNALEVLFLMSLIKIKDGNTFWMHDQVRDLGREIVHKENHNDPCECSRVHHPGDVLSILTQKEGSKNTQALSLGYNRILQSLGYNGIILNSDKFLRLKNLRFFKGLQVSFVGDFSDCLSNLRWLSCHHCPSKFEAKNFHMTELVVLEVSWSNISEECFDGIKAARKLKVLDVSHCFELRGAPNLSMLESLEILRLRNCVNLKSVDSIKEARNLKVLDLSNCNMLKGAPNLSTSVLEILRLRNCGSLESVDWIKEARTLKVLDLTKCSRLRGTPNLSTLVSLEILILSYCVHIEKLPDSIGKLQSLIELDMSEVGIHPLPDSFRDLKQLKTLRMMDIEGGITKLPHAIWLVQFLVDTIGYPKSRGHLYCLKMPDLPWTQISGLPTVASLCSNIHKLELAAQDSKQSWDPAWTAICKLENVIVLLPELRTQSQLEELILASPNMQFLLQLPSSLRELVFRELANIEIRHVFRLYWMPIFLGTCDWELEKLLMQDCTFTRRLQLLESKMGRSPNL